MPDFVLHVKQGDNYGFPKCNGTKRSSCTGFTRPFQQFAPHSDNGGIAIVGTTIYLGQFGFAPGHPSRVVTIPVTAARRRRS